MNTTVIYVSTAIIGVVLSILSILLWKNRYGNQFITAELIPKRQVYKNISVFGLLLFVSGLLYFYEALGYTENTTFLWLLAPCLMVMNSRTMFDPYYTTEIVSHIDELCLYLRPFHMNTKNQGKAHGFLWILEPIEKLLCGRLEKKDAYVVSLMFEPLWYIAYNRWPKLWILLLIIYSVFAFAFPLFITQDVYLYLVCSLLLFTPWLWLGPRITSSCNRWGSREVVRRTNVVLMKWVIVFGLITFLLGIMEV